MLLPLFLKSTIMKMGISMITDAMAEPITRFATKSFTTIHASYNLDRPTIKKIFFDQWDDFLKDPQVI